MPALPPAVEPNGDSSSFFARLRHLEPTAGADSAEAHAEWRIKNTRIFGGVLTVCLNSEVEPPDCPCPRALRTEVGRQICGIDPTSESQLDSRKVVAKVGKALEGQYERLHGSRSSSNPMLFKQCLDPTAESLHRTCSRLRREARDETLLFHFSGHGVPAPSTLGEMWLFNDTYTGE